MEARHIRSRELLEDDWQHKRHRKLRCGIEPIHGILIPIFENNIKNNLIYKPDTEHESFSFFLFLAVLDAIDTISNANTYMLSDFRNPKTISKLDLKNYCIELEVKLTDDNNKDNQRVRNFV